MSYVIGTDQRTGIPAIEVPVRCHDCPEIIFVSAHVDWADAAAALDVPVPATLPDTIHLCRPCYLKRVPNFLEITDD